MRPFVLILFVSLMVSACDIKPQPINYGQDNCAYCNMTIVDKQHASQIVTDKGRAYKFDAIECMINYNKEHPDKEAALYLINDFKNPGELIDATKASYLVSPKIKSPMGANLSGFKSEEAGQQAKDDYTGELFDWENIQQEIGK